MRALYDTLNLLECIPLAVFMFCMFVGRQKRWDIITRFVTVIILLIFNLVQLTLEIALEESMFFSIFLSVTWTLYLLVSVRDFYHAIKRK
jgi:hypothetical protein